MSRCHNGIGQTEKPRVFSILIGRTLPGRSRLFCACLDRPASIVIERACIPALPQFIPNSPSIKKFISCQKTSATICRAAKPSRVPTVDHRQAEDPVVEAASTLTSDLFLVIFLVSQIYVKYFQCFFHFPAVIIGRTSASYRSRYV